MIHDPNATLDYGRDWDRYDEGAPAGSGYLDAGETIASSSWSIGPAGPDRLVDLVIETSPAHSHTDTTTTVWISGGTLGHDYRLINHITTSTGRSDDRSTLIQVREQ